MGADCPECRAEYDASTGDNMTSERRNITQPADWWAALEKQATAEGMTLSEWIGWACKAKLPRGIGIHAGLSDRPAANRPKKPKDKGR